jgi:hypothetical protein
MPKYTLECISAQRLASSYIWQALTLLNYKKHSQTVNINHTYCADKLVRLQILGILEKSWNLNGILEILEIQEFCGQS